MNDSDKKIKYYVADKLYNNGFRNDDVISLLIDKYKPDPNSETYPDSMALKRFVEVAGNASVQYLIKYAYAKAKLIGQRLSVIVDIFEKDKDTWELCWNEKPSPSKNEEKILKFCYYNQCDKVTLLNKDNIHLLISYCVSGHTFAMWGKATSQNKYSGKWIKPYGYDKYSSGDICIEFVSENKAKGWASYGEGKQVLFELRNAIIEESKRQQIPSLQEEGNDAIKNQNWNAAVQVYTKLLEIAPEDYDANANIGAAYTMLNEFDLSIKHLTKAQQLKPAEYQPCYLMGVAYARKGDKDRAMESLQDAINRRPDDLLVSDLGKDTNLPEDFKQDQRFKGMLAKLTFKKLISSVKDTNLFDNHFQEFPNRFEEVWDAVDYALKKQREKIIQSDKQTGIIITDMTFDWDGKIYNQYYILVEKRNESLSVINFKLLTYHKIKNKSTTMEEGFMKMLKGPELKPANSSYTNQVAMSFLECVRKRLKNSK